MLPFPPVPGGGKGSIPPSTRLPTGQALRRGQPRSQRSTKPPAASPPRQHIAVSKSPSAPNRRLTSAPGERGRAAPGPRRNGLQHPPGNRVELVTRQDRATRPRGGQLVAREGQVLQHIPGTSDADGAPLPDDLVTAFRRL